MPRNCQMTNWEEHVCNWVIIITILDCIHPDENNSGGNLKDYTLLVGPGYLC